MIFSNECIQMLEKLTGDLKAFWILHDILRHPPLFTTPSQPHPTFYNPSLLPPPGSLSKSYIYIWVEKYFRLMELKVTCIVPIPTLAQYLYLTNNRIDKYSSGSHPDTCSISISIQQQNRYIYIAPVHLKYRTDL